MEHKPSEQMLTKIDSFILRQLEMESDLSHKELEKRIFNRYGYEVSVSERLTHYTNRDGELPFPNWN